MELVAPSKLRFFHQEWMFVQYMPNHSPHSTVDLTETMPCGMNGSHTSSPLHCTALHCTALHCTALYCTALHCTALHCTALHCSSSLHCTVLHIYCCTAIVHYCTVAWCGHTFPSLVWDDSLVWKWATSTPPKGGRENGGIGEEQCNQCSYRTEYRNIMNGHVMMKTPMEMSNMIPIKMVFTSPD